MDLPLGWRIVDDLLVIALAKILVVVKQDGLPAGSDARIGAGRGAPTGRGFPDTRCRFRERARGVATGTHLTQPLADSSAQFGTYGVT